MRPAQAGLPAPLIPTAGAPSIVSALEGHNPLSPPSPAVRARWLAIRGVQGHVAGDLTLPAGAVVEELLLVVEQLLASLDGELVIRPLHDGVDRARLLAVTAINTLHHVDVVAGGAAGAVVAARPRLDGDE